MEAHIGKHGVGVNERNELMSDSNYQMISATSTGHELRTVYVSAPAKELSKRVSIPRPFKVLSFLADVYDSTR